MFAQALNTVSDFANTAPVPSFMGFAADEVTRAALSNACADIGWPAAEIIEGNLDDAIKVLAIMPTPELLAVDISGCGDPVAGLTALAEVCDHGTRLLMLGDVNDVSLYRSLMDQGVHDYLVKPVSSETLITALEEFNENKALDANPKENTGRLVCVIGARGGVGATTIAVNCGWLMANEMEMRVVIADLDLYFGTTALSLDLEPGRGLREALENPGRIDELFVSRALVPAGGNLSVLGAEESLSNGFAFDEPALDLLIGKLLSSFDCVVADVPRASVAAYTGMLAAANDVVIVSDPSLAGMRDTMRLAAHVREAAPHAGLLTVINRYGFDKNGELGRKDFENGAGFKIEHMIPLDIKASAQAAARAKPMAEAAPKGKASEALRDIARRVSGKPAEEAPSLWRRLMKGGK